MEKIQLQLDLGDKTREARRYARDNPDVTLRDFLVAYPDTQFWQDRPPPESDLDLAMSNFVLQPVDIDPEQGMAFDLGKKKLGGDLRAELDRLWELEQAGEIRRAPIRCQTSLTDDEAVRTAYHLELEAIADFLRHGLSVLVACDKVLTEFIYEFVCGRAGKKAVLDTDTPGAVQERQGLGGRMDESLQGSPANPLANLPLLIRDLREGEVLVLRSLDMLDNPPLIELLYQRAGKKKPQLLAFLDPSLEVKKVLSDRFAVHVSLMGLPRHVCLDGETQEYTVNRLLTREEYACFAEYDPEGLYKNVSGLNAVQFRNAMQYVAARVAEGSDPVRIYRLIRQFKTSSSDEIEIPDTTFEDIGGYEHVKAQLQRIITLVAGPIAGISERQRGQLIPRGFVFHGPPGTGKTLFAKAIANEMNATIQMISGPEIMDKYVGQSENNLRRIFATARRNAPAVVFFDEFDSIASQRSTYSDGGARANNAVVAQFLTELDGFRQEQAVLVIGTTNRIDIIDEALLRPSRLQPIEIGLPDHVARQRVAQIHAHNFGVDRLLQDLYVLAEAHLDDWPDGGEAGAKGQIPPAFLEALFADHPPYQIRYEAEAGRADLLRGLREFFVYVRDSRQGGDGGAETALLEQLTERLQKMGQRYGMDLGDEQLSELDPAQVEAWLLPMQTDLRDLFALLRQERRKRGGLTPETFVSAVMDLVAEYTTGFNNDEIRAIFQEASLEHHMEGQLVTPRYVGQKIGLIRKRRDEREAVHLSSERGRR